MEQNNEQNPSMNWNKGEKSGMLPLERLKLHNIWLAQQHLDCKKPSTKPETIVEGIDNKWDNDFQGFVKF